LSYCRPGYSIKKSNIGDNQSISLPQAEIACGKNPKCKGFTYNKNTKKYILKRR